MNLNHTILIMMFILLTTSCSTTLNLVGLWQIEKVKIGNKEMTPISRWTRINKDQTQESGNGWNQHSIGHWQYFPENESIHLTNSNGLKDNFGAFAILSITDQEMKWSRNEEGENVVITLKRIEKLPQSPSNKLLGSWRLKNSKKENIESYLFFRWDQILVSRQLENEKTYATYKTHGHKQELQIIYHKEPLIKETWNYRFNQDNNLILESTRSDSGKKLEYEKIDYIPK